MIKPAATRAAFNCNVSATSAAALRKLEESAHFSSGESQLILPPRPVLWLAQEPSRAGTIRLEAEED
jgi:hypothetical protein